MIQEKNMDKAIMITDRHSETQNIKCANGEIFRYVFIELNSIKGFLL